MIREREINRHHITHTHNYTPLGLLDVPDKKHVKSGLLQKGPWHALDLVDGKKLPAPPRFW